MLSFRIALRYLFSRKSHSAINLITLVAACGVGVITAAMVCILSVYNGFESLVGDLCSRFDPELRITPTEGRHFHDDGTLAALVLAHADVEAIAPVVDEMVLLSYSGHQVPARMMGIDSTFAAVTEVDSLLLGDEGLLLRDPVADYCILGAGLGSHLGMSRGFVRPLTVYCPQAGKRINAMKADEAFNTAYLYCSNVFMVQQSDYDDRYFLCHLDVARRLMADSLLVSSYAVRLRPGARAERVRDDLCATMPGFDIATQYEQQADAYRIMRIEKWVTFLLIIFILIIASFNAIGALSMLIIDKTQQAQTLRTLGASEALVGRIFWWLGLLITGLGAVGGAILGIGLCLLQQHYGLIALGGGDTAHYVVTAYPVALQAGDVLLTLAVVALMGWCATGYVCRQRRPGSTQACAAS